MFKQMASLLPDPAQPWQRSLRRTARRVAVVSAFALVLPGIAVALAPNDPRLAQQWYLQRDRVFAAWALLPANLTAVRVGIVDSGIDGTHPEFIGKVVAAQSFVGGDPLTDEQGHGTFVAGEIAAAVDNGQGIAGIAPSAQLLIAKVVAHNGIVPARAEVAGIRWAVTQGARVINLSLGGVRDPASANLDAYSPAEAAAIRYAVAHGVVVVAAVGNGDRSPSEPWPFASYPAALAHVIGVSAINEGGNVPLFSNRDPIFNDLAAPGVDLLSTVPRSLTAARPDCQDQGYSDCAADSYLHAQGTSFAAPQVAAAAADLLSIQPTLRPDQVSWLLERSARDLKPETSCGACTAGRDPLSGWGGLDIGRAITLLLAGRIPPPDSHEPNDGSGAQAYPLYGERRQVDATVDYWDDPNDVYRVHLNRGQTLDVLLDSSGSRTRIRLLAPGTPLPQNDQANADRVLARPVTSGNHKSMTYQAESTGWYELEVQAAGQGLASYTLTFTKSTPPASDTRTTVKRG